MRTARSFTVTLPPEVADIVDEKLATGEYASESDIVSDALRGLRELSPAVERWLVDEVVPSCRETADDPSLAAPLKGALERLRARRGTA